jgi:hypothetical protein
MEDSPRASGQQTSENMPNEQKWGYLWISGANRGYIYIRGYVMEN